MLSRALRPLRALRVLLACVVLWLGTPGSAPQVAFHDTAAVVMPQAAAARDGESRREGEDVSEANARLAIPAPCERTNGPAVRPAQALTERPARDLFLRNCVLLC
jgi:hypothetical protein